MGSREGRQGEKEGDKIKRKGRRGITEEEMKVRNDLGLAL